MVYNKYKLDWGLEKCLYLLRNSTWNCSVLCNLHLGCPALKEANLSNRTHWKLDSFSINLHNQNATSYKMTFGTKIIYDTKLCSYLENFSVTPYTVLASNTPVNVLKGILEPKIYKLETNILVTGQVYLIYILVWQLEKPVQSPCSVPWKVCKSSHLQGSWFHCSRDVSNGLVGCNIPPGRFDCGHLQGVIKLAKHFLLALR